MSDIHDLMHENTPDEPSTAGWADQVRGRRRRGRTLTGVAAGVLAVGLAVPVGVSVLNRPVEAARPADALGAPAGPPEPAPLQERTAADVCAEAGPLMFVAANTTEYKVWGDPVLKEGAVRAWLCGDDTVQDGVAFGTRGPLDPLTVDVDKAISWFLTAPEADRDGVCTADYRLTYIVAFEYDDGSLIPVSGELHGCRTVTDGSRMTTGGEEFLDLLADLWATNRAPDFEAPAQPCAATGTILVAKPEDTTSAAVCRVEQDGTVRSAEVEDAAAIGAAIAADAVVADETQLSFSDLVTLELANKAGEIVRFDHLEDGTYLSYENGTPMLWTPTADEAAVLDAAIANLDG